jgi:hypothetical protein
MITASSPFKLLTQMIKTISEGGPLLAVILNGSGGGIPNKE